MLLDRMCPIDDMTVGTGSTVDEDPSTTEYTHSRINYSTMKFIFLY